MLEIIALILLVAMPADPPASPDAPTPPAQRAALVKDPAPRAASKRADTPQRVRTIQLASRMAEISFHCDRAELGRIQDLAFDLETGHLALVVTVKTLPAESGEAKRYTLVPFLEAMGETRFRWSDDLTMESPPEAITRSVVQYAYQTFQRDVYWLRYCKRLEAALRDQFDQRDFQLTTFSFLKGRPIIDLHNETVGKLVDLGINPANGRIVYCVVESPDKALRAIPLGAFVMPQSTYRWMIELPKSKIDAFQPFPADAPPIAVDRGWREYVALRYGRTGLQTEKKADRAIGAESAESQPRP